MYGRLILNMFVKIACSLLILVIVTVVIVALTIGLMIAVPCAMFDGIVKEKRSFTEALNVIKDMTNEATDKFFERARDSLFTLWA